MTETAVAARIVDAMTTWGEGDVTVHSPAGDGGPRYSRVHGENRLVIEQDEEITRERSQVGT